MSEPWYKRNARDFYEGTRRLTLEQRGAYTDLIDLIYIHDGEVPDDQDWLAHALHISRRKWRTIRTALIEAEKIASVDGKITNSRAEIELSERRQRREINRENASGPRRFGAGSEPVQSGTSAEPTMNRTKKLNENNENEKQVPTDIDIDKDKLGKANALKVVEDTENPPPDEKPTGSVQKRSTGLLTSRATFRPDHGSNTTSGRNRQRRRTARHGSAGRFGSRQRHRAPPLRCRSRRFAVLSRTPSRKAARKPQVRSSPIQIASLKSPRKPAPKGLPNVA
jgi:uncharacterized protein YdaU (DUF1376 family)